MLGVDNTNYSAVGLDSDPDAFQVHVVDVRMGVHVLPPRLEPVDQTIIRVVYLDKEPVHDVVVVRDPIRADRYAQESIHSR